jgi:hypothetical protein
MEIQGLIGEGCSARSRTRTSTHTFSRRSRRPLIRIGSEAHSYKRGKWFLPVSRRLYSIGDAEPRDPGRKDGIDG